MYNNGFLMHSNESPLSQYDIRNPYPTFFFFAIIQTRFTSGARIDTKIAAFVSEFLYYHC